MPRTFEQLAEEALQLPADARALLADRLTESLDIADLDEETQRLWATEAARRGEEIRSGRVRAIPAEEVLAEARQLAGREP